MLPPAAEADEGRFDPTAVLLIGMKPLWHCNFLPPAAAADEGHYNLFAPVVEADERRYDPAGVLSLGKELL